jgi:hypothetical protein
VIQRYYEHADTIALQKLSEIVSDLYLAEGAAVTRLWNSARTALAKLTPADDPHVAKVLSVRSVSGLAKLVNELSAGVKSAARTSAEADDLEPIVGAAPLAPPAAAPPPPAPNQPAAPQPVTPDQIKHAMKAFRKRLKRTRLDDESKLGNRAMTGGRQSAVVAIMAPREYPPAVWDELVKQGKLKSSGGGFYELTET